MRKSIALAGSFAAYYMGAAFASGQEIMQFFTSFGVKGLFGLLVTLAIYLATALTVQSDAVRENFEDPYMVFPHYLGKRPGVFFVWFMEVLMVCNIIMMTASAGANVNENLGLPNVVGRCVIFASAITVCLGLDKMVEVLSRLGPVIAVCMVIIAVIAVVKADHSLLAGSRMTEQLDIYRGGSNWVSSVAKYAFYCNMATFPIMVVCGLEAGSEQSARRGALFEIAVLAVVCFIMFTAQLMNIEEVYNYQIPNLRLVAIYLPVLSAVFSVLLLLCTYSSSTVMLWTVVRKFTKEGSPVYYGLTVGIACCGVFLSGLLPFNVILNKLFTVGLVLGPIYLLAVLVSTFRRKERGGRKVSS